MTTPVKTFKCKISDPYGGEWPQASVAILKWKRTSEDVGEAEGHDDTYDVSSGVEAITYQANFWYDETKKQQGFRSQPLIVDEDGSLTKELTVDLNKPGVLNLLDSEVSLEEKTVRIIHLDLSERFL